MVSSGDWRRMTRRHFLETYYIFSACISFDIQLLTKQYERQNEEVIIVGFYYVVKFIEFLSSIFNIKLKNKSCFFPYTLVLKKLSFIPKTRYDPGALEMH